MATKKSTKEPKTVTDPQVALHEATHPHDEIISALKKKDIVATIWDNPLDENLSYVKLDSATNNRLVSLTNEELDDKGIVDRLEGLVRDPEQTAAV
jgi:hypothetical protein